MEIVCEQREHDMVARWPCKGMTRGTSTRGGGVEVVLALVGEAGGVLSPFVGLLRRGADAGVDLSPRP